MGTEWPRTDDHIVPPRTQGQTSATCESAGCAGEGSRAQDRVDHPTQWASGQLSKSTRRDRGIASGQGLPKGLQTQGKEEADPND